MTAPGPLAVLGAGSVGCWIGGRLAAAGVEVHFVGRPRVLGDLRAHGLTVSDLRDAADAPPRHLPPAALHLHDSPATLPPPALVLLCVKSGDTAAAIGPAAAALPPGTPVISFQNGVSNAEVAQAAAPALAVCPGMVPFNIAEIGPGRFHRGTTGALAAQDTPALRAWADTFAAAGLPLTLHADMRAVQWGKLLLNLNNPVNALSGQPLRAQLLDRGYRRCLAALQDEALALLRVAGIRPAQVAALSPGMMPTVLRLPDVLFTRVAARMLRIDGHARSSMADDLARGRATEIDALSGEVVRLAERLGRDAPRNRRIAERVRGWPQRPQPLSSAELLALLG